MNINISIDDVDPADLPVTVVVDSGAYEDAEVEPQPVEDFSRVRLDGFRPAASADGFLAPLDPKAV